MKIKKKLKRDTKIVILSVIVLTMATVRISYAAIFSVKSQSTVQEISTGTLDVSIDGSAAMSSDDMFPTSDSDLPTAANPVAEGSYASLVLKNNGSLDANYSVTIGYDNDKVTQAGKTTDDLISLEYLKVGIYDEDNHSWVNFGSDGASVYHTTITGLTANDSNVYPILRGVITKKDGTSATTRQFRVYVWLSENTPTSEIGKLVYLKLDVKSTTTGSAEG